MNVAKVWKLANRAGLDGFILGLIGMIILARLWPSIGTGDGTFSLSSMAGYGISLIFFFYGLRLGPEKLKAGLHNWKLHGLIHTTTFVVFPLIVLCVRPLLAGTSYEMLWMGAFFLAALPSTVSSSVVMVSIAGGNIPAAIFNASISSLLGVFITPLWMKLEMTSAGGYDFTEVIVKLVVQVIVPILLGLLLHARLGIQAEKYRKQLRYFDQGIILLIIYTSFCDSFERHMFSHLHAGILLLLALSMVTLLLLGYGIIRLMSRLLGFNREDTITAVFCGSKKSLVHGTVMSRVLFAGTPYAGVLLLPVMLFHASQLILASMLAQSMSRKAKEQAA